MDISQDRGGSDDYLVLPRSVGSEEGNKKGLPRKILFGRYPYFAYGIATDSSGLLSPADILFNSKDFSFFLPRFNNSN